MPERPEDKVWKVIRAIPPGRVRGYGEVARLAGFPRRARWVARLLSTQAPAGLPWHRVLRSDGRIAFAADSEDFKRQAAALRKEGVVLRNGRVLKARPRDEDEALWGPRD